MKKHFTFGTAYIFGRIHFRKDRFGRWIRNSLDFNPVEDLGVAMNNRVEDTHLGKLKVWHCQNITCGSNKTSHVALQLPSLYRSRLSRLCRCVNIHGCLKTNTFSKISHLFTKRSVAQRIWSALTTIMVQEGEILPITCQFQRECKEQEKLPYPSTEDTYPTRRRFYWSFFERETHFFIRTSNLASCWFVNSQANEGAPLHTASFWPCEIYSISKIRYI